MNKVKETPINFRVYYHNMQERIKEGINNIEEKLDKVYSDIEVLAKDIVSRKDKIESVLNIKLSDYQEIEEERYIDGKLFDFANTKLIKGLDDYKAQVLLPLVMLANKLNYSHNLEYKLHLYEKCSKLGLKEYTEYLRTYFTEVHKALVKDGSGYLISKSIGWICISRIKNTKKKAVLDYKKTKEKKEEILARGGRIYNEEEKKWCEERGLPYEYEEHRVYQEKPEYIYEIPLLGCKLPEAWHFRFATADYRATETRGKTNEELIELADNNIDKVLEEKIDVRLKLNLALTIDKTLYVKYIRNENQESITTRKAYSKNR